MCPVSVAIIIFIIFYCQEPSSLIKLCSCSKRKSTVFMVLTTTAQFSKVVLQKIIIDSSNPIFTYRYLTLIFVGAIQLVYIQLDTHNCTFLYSMLVCTCKYMKIQLCSVELFVILQFRLLKLWLVLDKARCSLLII